MPENILIERPSDGVGLIRLNRPKQLNALNQQTFDEITGALTGFLEAGDIRVVVITGSERVFAAGADVTDMLGRDTAQITQDAEVRWEQWELLRTYPFPLIAAVSGWCLGGGNELAMSCDMIVASETATFGQPEINLAIMPGAGGTQRLTHAVGKVVAMEMALAGRFLSAREAQALGLVNNVVPVELYLDKALALAAKVAGQAPVAAQYVKEAVSKAFELPLSEGLRFERERFYALFDTQDKEEGIKAFLEKRKPEWKGR